MVDTNIAICSGVQSEDGTDIFVCLLKSDGRTLWSKNYYFSEPTAGWRIASDQGANLVVLGSFTQSQDILLLKLKPDGDTLWTRRYDSGGKDKPNGLALDQFGNIVAVGTAGEGDSERCVILEYAADGSAVRKVTYQADARAEGNDVFISEKGGIYICGTILTPREDKSWYLNTYLMRFRYGKDSLLLVALARQKQFSTTTMSSSLPIAVIAPKISPFCG